MTARSRLPETCRAAVVTAFNQPVEMREVPIPELEHGALLVKIDAATVCGSDVHLWDGSLNAIRPINLPVIPGHEMAGTIVALGEGVHTDVTGEPRRSATGLSSHRGDVAAASTVPSRSSPTSCTNRKHYGTNCERHPYLVGAFAEYCYVYPTSRRIKVPRN